MPLIGNYAPNATVKVLWLLALLVFTAPEGTPVGIMTEQLETVTRATHDAPPGSRTVLRFTSGQRTFLREQLFMVLKQIHDASQSREQPPPQPMLPPQHPETPHWHFVNIPIHPSAGEPKEYDPIRDCPRGDCVVTKIEEFERVLSDRQKPYRERLDANQQPTARLCYKTPAYSFLHQEQG